MQGAGLYSYDDAARISRGRLLSKLLETGRTDEGVTHCCHLRHTPLQLWWCTGTQLLQLQHWKAAPLTALLVVS
jgi:hypothetical protein